MSEKFEQTEKIMNIETFEFTDLIRAALSTPDGWHKEVHVENGEVFFTSPLTANTQTLDPETLDPLPTYVGDLDSFDIDDVSGLYLRLDGKVEVDMGFSPDSPEGEYYEHVDIISYDEAVERIAEILWDANGEFVELYNVVVEKLEK